MFANAEIQSLADAMTIKDSTGVPSKNIFVNMLAGNTYVKQIRLGVADSMVTKSKSAGGNSTGSLTGFQKLVAGEGSVHTAKLALASKIAGSAAAPANPTGQGYVLSSPTLQSSPSSSSIAVPAILNVSHVATLTSTAQKGVSPTAGVSGILSV